MTARKPASNLTNVVFQFIVRFRNEHGYAPTLNEISKGVYLSRSGVWRHLEKLEAQGRICREKGVERAIRVLDEVHS